LHTEPRAARFGEINVVRRGPVNGVVRAPNEKSMMIAHVGNETIPIHAERDLQDVTNRRDRKNGLEVWFAESTNSFPCIAVRISPPWCDIHFFPHDGHPGFRCMSNEFFVEGETRFLFQGCDPGDGELVPNEFVIPVEDMQAIVWQCMMDRAPAATRAWYEL
jgi:hypothetical protein